MRLSLRKVVAVLDGQPTGMKGQSLVEMAFTFPILIMMILGIAEIGFLANNVLTLLDVVREASRRAVTLDPRSWNAKDGEAWARWGERMDCDNTRNIYSLQLGLPPASNRDEPSESRHTQVSLPGYTQGSEPISGEYGFFDGIACYAISIMDPLIFDDTATGKDDIVVSAVSYALMNYSGDLATTGYDDTVIAAERIAKRNANSQDAYVVTVTGRWPLENRFCRSNANATLNDERDPFDYLRRANLLEVRYHTYIPGLPPQNASAPVTDGTRGQVNELYETDPITFDVLQPSKYVLSNAEQQGVRGYVFTGKMRNEENAGCYGSKWTVQAIEQKLNYDLATKKALLQEKFSNGGIVIVEMQWQYHPFFLGRIWNDLRGIFWRGDNLRENDPVLYVYSMFPVTSIEPTATP